MNYYDTPLAKAGNSKPDRVRAIAEKLSVHRDPVDAIHKACQIIELLDTGIRDSLVAFENSGADAAEAHLRHILQQWREM